MTGNECAKYLRKYRDNPEYPLAFKSGYCYDEKKEYQKFIDVMNKAIKICNEYDSQHRNK